MGIKSLLKCSENVLKEFVSHFDVFKHIKFEVEVGPFLPFLGIFLYEKPIWGQIGMVNRQTIPNCFRLF